MKEIFKHTHRNIHICTQFSKEKHKGSNSKIKESVLKLGNNGGKREPISHQSKVRVQNPKGC